MTVFSTEIIDGFLKGIRPLERLTVSEWADAYRYLSPKASAEPGKWRTSRTPYLKEPMDEFSRRGGFQIIIFMKGAQLGMTEAGFNMIGYFIDVDPGPIMYVMPTDKTMIRNSKIRLQPMIDATPRLSNKIKRAKSRDSGNSMFQKDFPGGTLILAGANSGSNLRSVPIKVLVLDEVDAYPLDLDGEGSPVELAMARTRTFNRKKVFMLSTPTIKGASMIELEYDSTTQRKYFVPCPHCNHMQHLRFEQLKWQPGIHSTVLYHCEECGEGIHERFKTKMLSAGKWQDTVPEKASFEKIGYHLNSLYSPYGWLSWADIAKKYEEAVADKTGAKMKTFVNTILGETYKESGEAPDWKALHERKEGYATNEPPVDVVLLTAGVDVQKDRLELEVVGWASGGQTYSIDYRVIPGDTSSQAVWTELKSVIYEKWEREDGVLLPLARTAIDSGFNTADVYKFCRLFHPSQVFPVKGQDRQNTILSQPRAVDVRINGKKTGSLKLWSIGVSILKQELYGYLKLPINDDGTFPDGYCHFPRNYNEHYFKMLTAEELQEKVTTNNFIKYEWVKIRERNEALDCRNYARAAAASIGIDRWGPNDWKAVASKFAAGPGKQQRKKRKRNSSFW